MTDMGMASHTQQLDFFMFKPYYMNPNEVPSLAPLRPTFSSHALANSGILSWDKPGSRRRRRAVATMLVGRVPSGKVRAT